MTQGRWNMGKGHLPQSRRRAFAHQLENPPSSPIALSHWLRAKPGPRWVMSTELSEESLERMRSVFSVPVKPVWMDWHFGWEMIGPGQFRAPLPPGWSAHRPYKEAACGTTAILPAASSDLRWERGESISRVQLFFLVLSTVEFT